MTVTLRPITDDDLPFLNDVYASTRQEELAPVPWSEAEKEAFLRMQFDAQHRHYAEHYPNASFDVILVDGAAAGRLYVDRRETEIRIVDIALLPAFRQRGIGTRLLTGLLDEGARSGRPVGIHVERFNPALRLYQRLGFVPIEDREVYLLMRWTPPGRDDQVKTAS